MSPRPDGLLYCHTSLSQKEEQCLLDAFPIPVVSLSSSSQGLARPHIQSGSRETKATLPMTCRTACSPSFPRE